MFLRVRQEVQEVLLDKDVVGASMIEAVVGKERRRAPGESAREPTVCPKPGHQAGGAASRVALGNFQSNPLFPRIQRAVAAILANSKVVTPIDVLIRMELLKAEDVENWRFGRVPYLERVIHCNLTKLGRILRILRLHANALKLVPSRTTYVRWGKRGHRVPLRFSKTGDPNVEEAYARHFVWPGKGPFHLPCTKPGPTSSAPPKPTSEP